MRPEHRSVSRWMRGLALACIALLGLVAIVGSGGGGGDFLNACILCGHLPAPPSVQVQPAHPTVLVGTTVTYTAETTGLEGGLSYQWSRTSGDSWVDIPGATGMSHALASVDMADDGAAFRVTVTASNGVPYQAVAYLAVSSTPGLVFEDGEFLPADWLASPVLDAGQPEFVHTEQRVASGGNPGAFRRMSYQVPQGASGARAFNWSSTALYSPALQGAIATIDYAEDSIASQSSAVNNTLSFLAIDQNGRRFITTFSHPPQLLTSWSAAANRPRLLATDFQLLDGPACSAGESCPDFSATAAPMRFGYYRSSGAASGVSVEHGIDNWKVTVWRR